jgi:RecB family exonuclease
VPPDEAAEDLYDLPEQLDAEVPPPGGPYTTFLGSRFASSRPTLIEAPFELNVGGIRIKGRIDAIYELPSRPWGRNWEVVDFKSGRRPPEGDLGRESRKVQLQAYAVAVDNGVFGRERPDGLAATFAYLGAGLEEVTEAVDSQWLEIARHRLSELSGRIVERRFDPTPSPACHGCDYLRFCEAGRRFVEQAVPA